MSEPAAASAPPGNPPASGSPSSHWRIIVAGLLLAASLWSFALEGGRQARGPAPEWHTNAVGAFRVRPPAGWDRRTDDRDGSQIAPMTQPATGFAMLVVSARFAVDPDALRHIADAVARPPAGPIRALTWQVPVRVTMEDGAQGAIVEFAQTYRGAEVRGLMLVTVRNARLLQAVATVPADRFTPIAAELRRSLLSLRPL